MAPRYVAREQEEDDSQPWNPYEDDLSEYYTAKPTQFGSPFTTDNDGSATGMPFPTTGEHSFPTSVSLPHWLSKKQSETFSTPTGASPYPENGESTMPPTLIQSNELSPSSTDRPDDDDNGSGPMEDKGPNNGGVYVTAGVVPVVMLLIIGAIVFFCVRKRRRRNRAIAAAQARVNEMKARNQANVQAYMASPTEAHYSAPPAHSPPPTSPATPPPVILGPITGNSNGAYLTGIDTSDVVSVRDERTGLGNPFADGDSLTDEPPPPYRPRSIAPLSRDTSLRVPPSAISQASSQTNLVAGHSQPLRSPFADPNDDAVSDISGPTPRRNQDTVSIVSDMSYQNDPVVARRAM